MVLRQRVSWSIVMQVVTVQSQFLTEGRDQIMRGLIVWYEVWNLSAMRNYASIPRRGLVHMALLPSFLIFLVYFSSKIFSCTQKCLLTRKVAPLHEYQLSILLIKLTLEATLGDGERGRRLWAPYNKTSVVALFILHDELPLQISSGETGVFHLAPLCTLRLPLEFATCRTRGSLGVLPVGMLPVYSPPCNAICY